MRCCPLSRCATAACGRPRRSSDSPLDCHSLLRLRFAYPHPLRDRGAFLFLLYWVFAFQAIVCYNIMTEISHPKGETI